MQLNYNVLRGVYYSSGFYIATLKICQTQIMFTSGYFLNCFYSNCSECGSRAAIGVDGGKNAMSGNQNSSFIYQ